jgi:FixJ family two-component response regulator
MSDAIPPGTDARDRGEARGDGAGREPAVIRVVDDDERTRRATARFLRLAGFAVREFASGAELLEAGPGGEPGCLVLDLRMPGVSGLEVQEALAARGVALPILFLTGFGDVPTTVRAMKAGASDFLTKPAEPEALLEAVRQAVARADEERALHAERDGLRARLAALTPRERQVFSLVVTGRLNKQIARLLGTTERTVKAHRAAVMEKMRAASVAELVRMADALGDLVEARLLTSSRQRIYPSLDASAEK